MYVCKNVGSWNSVVVTPKSILANLNIITINLSKFIYFAY